MKVQLFNDDCLKIMQEMNSDKKEVFLTITSPPYDNLRDYKGSLVWSENTWKTHIKALYDITKADGVVVWVVGDAVVDGSETGSSFKQALFFIECGFKLHDTMIYEKNSSSFPARADSNRYTQIFEYMFVFTKGTPIKNLICDKKNKWAGHKDYSKKLKNPVPHYSPRTNIWRYITSKGDTGGHPAPFPEQLVQDHIISWMKKGETIFDPYLGSGTTGKVAKLNGFSFIGIEKNKEYFDLAKKRIQKANPRLF